MHKLLGTLKCAFVASTLALSGSAVSATTVGVFNVKDYGAVGDGSTDDTNAIKRAIAAAEKVSGSQVPEVLFPNGQYLFSQDLEISGIRLQGTGQSELISARAGTIVLSGNNSGMVSLIITTRRAGVSAIRCDRATNATISSNVFNKGYMAEITLLETRNVSISGNTFNVTDKGKGIVAGSLNNSLSIRSNQFSCGNRMSAIAIFIDLAPSAVISNNSFSTFQTAIALQRSPSTTLASNLFQGCFTGALVESCDQSQCVSSTFSNCSGFALLVHLSSGITIDENQFATTLGAAIMLDKDKNCQITKNTIQGGISGINLTSASNVTLDQNSIDEERSTGLNIRGGANITIQNCSIQNVVGPGVLVNGVSDMSVKSTTIKKTGHGGIFESDCSGTVEIRGNHLQDCGLESATAVIYVNCRQATSIPIVFNDYTGNTRNLQYFVRAIQRQPLVIIFGNSTTTFLPIVTGP